MERRLPRVKECRARTCPRPFARSGAADAIQRVIGSALGAARRTDTRLERAMAMLHESAGDVTMSAVAQHAGLSARQLDRGFQRQFGMSPKLLARIARFRRALALGLHARRGAWADIAARCGYADQAHMVRDIREFAGETPEQIRTAIEAATPAV